MKKNIIEWIKIKGMGYTEIVITIFVEDDVQFDSIEWDEETESLILHKFVGEEFDYEIVWDDLPNNWKLMIYHQLIPPLLN